MFMHIVVRPPGDQKPRRSVEHEPVLFDPVPAQDKGHGLLASGDRSCRTRGLSPYRSSTPCRYFLSYYSENIRQGLRVRATLLSRSCARPAAREKAHKGAFNSRAAGLGLEPRYHEPKPCVLPLDDPAMY